MNGRIRTAIPICVLPVANMFSRDKLAYAPYAALLGLTQSASLLGQEHQTFLREEARRMVFQKPGPNWTWKTLTCKASLFSEEEDQKELF